MARIRTIKPEFWTSEQIAACSRDARLVFIGLWNFCDDGGIHPKSYKRLKMEILPGDDCSESDIVRWVEELLSAGLILEYAVERKDYWIVTGWQNHQKIDRPTHRHPKPNPSRSKFDECSKNPLQPLDEYSATAQLELDEPSTTEGNGKEWRGKEDIPKVPDETLAPSFGHSGSSANTQESHHEAVQGNPQEPSNKLSSENDIRVIEIFDYWKTVMQHPKAKLDRKRVTKIMAALKLGFTVEDLKGAIDGCSNTPFNMGENKQQKRYDDIELILRDASHIEVFMKNSPLARATENTDSVVSQIDLISAGAI